MFTVEVYGKKARQINAQDSSHRRAHTWVNAQGKERKQRSGEKKKGRNFFPVPGSGFEPGTITLEGKAPVCIDTITLHKDPWLQLLYKYHEGYILNSIAQYPMHMKKRERKCHRAEFEGTENY